MSLSPQEWQGVANERMVVVALVGRTSPRMIRAQFAEINDCIKVQR